MYIIPLEKVSKGDILLTSENSTTSKTVMKATGGKFSHAILYVGDGSYIHSDSKGVYSGNLQRLLMDSTENLKVLRLKDNKTIDDVCIFSRTQIGKAYSIKGAINAKIKISKKMVDNEQYCSRLVAQSYEYAGTKLVLDPNYCTPREIECSDLIFEVLSCTKEASEAEIKFANSDNPIARQANITNSILSKVRKLTGSDIQTLNQVI